MDLSLFSALRKEGVREEVIEILEEEEVSLVILSFSGQWN